LVLEKEFTLSQFIIYAGAILIGSGIAEFLLFWVSIQYEVYPDLVCWYFPAGFRFLLLLFLPVRYWGPVWLGGSIGLYLFFTNYVLSNAIFSENISYHIYTLCAFPIIYYVKSRYLTQEILTARVILAIVGAFIATRLLDTFLNLVLNGPLYMGTPEYLLLEVFDAHQLAALLPFLLMLMCVSLAVWLRGCTDMPNHYQLYKLFIANILIGIVLLTLHVIYPGLDNLLVVLVFIGIVWLGASNGFAALMSFTIAINGLLLLYLFDINNGELLLNYMPFMTSYCLVALFVGGYLLETDSVKLNLRINNDILANNNTKLRELSHRTITIQEQERKQLCQELHDEIGQNITALKTELIMIEREGLKHPNISCTEGVRHAADRIYDSVHNMMNWLRPTELDDVGLTNTLTGEFFASRLKAANIYYVHDITVDLHQVTPAQEIAIFRIVQESITNTIKHSTGDLFSVSIHQVANVLILSMSDNGYGFVKQGESKSGGFGLSSIEDRVTSLDGDFYIDSTDGFNIHVKLPLASYSEENGALA
jgi:glucose-6-phosphate-specific signal transduction histidine kinase